MPIKVYLIVCPFLFLAGLVDAIGGGGGLISLPAYLLAGLPVHQAIATNKISSTAGTTLATARFIKNGLVRWKTALPSVGTAFLGSLLGARLSLLVAEKYLLYLMLILLPVTAYLVGGKRWAQQNTREEKKELTVKDYVLLMGITFVIGIYDGFYGPGTGTFLIVAFTMVLQMELKRANAQAKVINLATNVTALFVFLTSKQVVLTLGIAAAMCNMVGGYVGSGMVLKNGSKVVRPVIMLVLGLLAIKVIGNLFF